MGFSIFRIFKRERVKMKKRFKETKLNKEDFRRLQLIELELLIEVDRICRKHNIKYCLACGTLLGAVRHGGFIPWDDDVDVWMLRNEYEKFRKVCKKELLNDYFLQNWHNDPYFNSAYSKLRKKGTNYVRVGQEKMKYKTGIYIDILPLDNLPDNYFTRINMTLRAWIFRKVTYSQAGAMCEKKLRTRLLYGLVNKLINLKTSKIRFQKMLIKYKDDETLWCKCLGDIGFNPHWRDNFLDLIEMKFEGYSFCVPKNYDSVLKVSFGNDYMSLPPINERKPHANVSIIDFGD